MPLFFKAKPLAVLDLELWSSQGYPGGAEKEARCPVQAAGGNESGKTREHLELKRRIGAAETGRKEFHKLWWV